MSTESEALHAVMDEELDRAKELLESFTKIELRSLSQACLDLRDLVYVEFERRAKNLTHSG